MFTGIISHLGKLEKVKGKEFTFSAGKSFCRNLKKSSSVAVNGACLTVVAKSKNTFSVDVMPETLNRTVLGDLKKGDLVNLELSLSASGRFEGHFVQGHVDGQATVVNIIKEGNSHLFKFRVDKSLTRYLVNKGSVAINGVSLTVIQAKNVFFTAGIIPYTWNNTTMKSLRVGDKVNIEVDILAKYVEKIGYRV
ncbi:riboflavin synthase subunit alpha [Candidatus Curtissbacteria bacterium RBG_13_40_7]|uniref:Riboflavin synthase n=1 Tax=Candidatus Curtissbacteria bacterium RBG_13_40_7 TaxID=1797706 RepID=A0A1F5FUP0_9BACT|nr:MAG: riboflavin synthase subunit alpha [Candidatus Curtissbacteria bacterium RBG_13_40_7]